uniref:AAA+ ATPase domain-containing protein n=1 Tax=Vitis vinifera TaxID=29760 RepID=F6HVK7_VITVI
MHTRITYLLYPHAYHHISLSKLIHPHSIKPPKGVLLYGPPGIGKTLLARAIASNIDANFLKVVSSAIIDKYIGERARLMREMFGYARDHQPYIIFMDEIDAIGKRRFSEGICVKMIMVYQARLMGHQFDQFSAHSEQVAPSLGGWEEQNSQLNSTSQHQPMDTDRPADSHVANRDLPPESKSGETTEMEVLVNGRDVDSLPENNSKEKKRYEWR